MFHLFDGEAVSDKILIPYSLTGASQRIRKRHVTKLEATGTIADPI